MSILSKFKSASKKTTLSKFKTAGSDKPKKTTKKAKKKKTPKKEKAPLCCDDCNLKGGCKTHCLQGQGSESPKILIVGESPGRLEDDTGDVFVDNAGEILTDALELGGYDMDEVRMTYLVKCYAPKGVDVKKKNVSCCIHYLEDEIKKYKPQVIIPLGALALAALSTVTGITKWAGQILDIGSSIVPEGTLIVPMLDPSYVKNNLHLVESYFDQFNSIRFDFEKRLGNYKVKEVEYKTIGTVDEVRDMLAELESKPTIAFDVETHGIYPFHKGEEILCIGLCGEETKAYCLPLYHKEAGWSDVELKTVSKLLKKFLEFNQFKLIGHNVKFDCVQLFANMGINITKIYADTMLMHYIVDCRRGIHDLSRLAHVYTDMGGYDKALDDFKAQDPKVYDPSKGGSYGNVPLDILGYYSAGDVDACLRIYHELKKEIDESGDYSEGFNWLAFSLMPAASSALANVEINGAYIDVAKVKFLDDFYAKKISEAETKVEQIPEVQQFIKDKMAEALAARGGKPSKSKKPLFEFNLGSANQLREVLFGYLGLDPIKKTKKGDAWSTDAEVLEALRGQHELVDLLLEHRGNTKLHGTYITPVLNPEPKKHRPALIARDGCIRSNYNIHGTETGRLSSSGPNLQNIPREGGIKKMFISRFGEDGLLLNADYSQIELRIVAALSGDDTMCQIYRDDKDLHMNTALSIHGKTNPEDIDGEMRVAAKKTNFGIVYGTGPSGLQGQLAADSIIVTEDEAAAYIDGFYEAYPGVREWIDETKAYCRKHHCSVSPFGRVRQFPSVASPQKWIREEALRGAVNHPVQGGASDCTLMSLCIINQEMQKRKMLSKMIMTVHDSLVFDVHVSEAPDLCELISNVMEGIVEEAPKYFGVDMSWITVPMKSDLEIGPNWKDLESV